MELYKSLLSKTKDNSNSNDNDVSSNHGSSDYWIVKLSNPAPFAGNILGDSEVCISDHIQLSRTGDAGGDWNSDNTAVATVDNTGKVTGVSVGQATISYEVSNSYGTDEATIDVNVKDCGAGINKISKTYHIQGYYQSTLQSLKVVLTNVPNGN